jgi:hypothetical protein
MIESQLSSRITFTIIGFFILNCIFACKTNQDIAGTYQSNFAVHGFFGTRIMLAQDSTFEYRMRGDMAFDTSYGTFRVIEGFVILHHKPYELDTAGKSIEEQQSIALSYALSTNKHLGQEDKYEIGKQKLFVCDKKGVVTKREFGHSKLRQFIIFGKHWYKRKY